MAFRYLHDCQQQLFHLQLPKSYVLTPKGGKFSCVFAKLMNVDTTTSHLESLHFHVSKALWYVLIHKQQTHHDIERADSGAVGAYHPLLHLHC